MGRGQQPEMVGDGRGKEDKRARGGGVQLRNPSRRGPHPHTASRPRPHGERAEARCCKFPAPR